MGKGGEGAGYNKTKTINLNVSGTLPVAHAATFEQQ